jgi:hypothetical protein
MGIEVTETGAIVATGDGIKVFQLLALKGALKMEAIGMKRRGKSALSIVKSMTGLKARTAEDMIPKYEAWLREMGVLVDKEVIDEEG